MTVFEAYQSAEKMRLKISQVLVLPPYQRKGVASNLYEMVYQKYVENPVCFEMIVEDAADDFQKVQDICNCNFLLKLFKQHNRMLPRVIQTPAQAKWMQLKAQDIRELGKLLKLPPVNLFRLNDLLTYCRLDLSNPETVREFRLQMKRRLFVRCMRNHPELFTGRRDEIAPELGGQMLAESYLWNELIEDDQFCRQKLD